VEHRLFGTAHVVAVVSTGSFFGRVYGKWRIGWVVLGTLLGPEGSGVSSALQFGPRLLVVLVMSLDVVGAGVWRGSARILRTTQWTRASLWPSF